MKTVHSSLSNSFLESQRDEGRGRGGYGSENASIDRLAVLGFSGCAGCSPVVAMGLLAGYGARRLLTAVASLVAELRPRVRKLQSLQRGLCS